MGIFDKGVKKTNMNFFQKLGRAIVGKSKVDDDVLDALEEALLSSDMGVDTTLKVIENLEDRVEKDKYVSMDELVDLIRDEIGKLLNVDENDAPVQPFDTYLSFSTLSSRFSITLRVVSTPMSDDRSASSRASSTSSSTLDLPTMARPSFWKKFMLVFLTPLSKIPI